MNWFTQFLTSSLGRKLIVSLTGLFLIIFLVVHLLGNLQLLRDDGMAFNMYADMMGKNPFIQTVSWGLYFFILLHAIQGIMVAIRNRQARKNRYAVKADSDTSFASRHMALLGILILVFIGIHMGDFWYTYKFGTPGMIQYDLVEVKNLYLRVEATFSNPIMVGFYVFSMIALAFHLWHGFESAFQTLGLRHKKYTPVIRIVGKVYSIIVPALFALIPLYFFFVKN